MDKWTALIVVLLFAALTVGQVKAQEACSFEGAFVDEVTKTPQNDCPYELQSRSGISPRYLKCILIPDVSGFDCKDHLDPELGQPRCEKVFAQPFRRIFWNSVFGNVCASGTLEGGVCVTVPEPGCLCPDGLPIDAANDLGYQQTCDRPELRQCDGGEVMFVDDICPTECVDFETCREDACFNESDTCGEGEYLEQFFYNDTTGDTVAVCGTTGDVCGTNPAGEDTCFDEETCLSTACNNPGTCPSGEYMVGLIYQSPENYAASCSATGNICGDNPNPPDTGQTDSGLVDGGGIDGSTDGGAVDGTGGSTDGTDSGSTGGSGGETDGGTTTGGGGSSDSPSEVNVDLTSLEDEIEAQKNAIVGELQEVNQGLGALNNNVGALGDRIVDAIGGIDGSGIGDGPCDPSQEGYGECILDFRISVTYQDSGFIAALSETPIFSAVNNVADITVDSTCPAFTLDTGEYGVHSTTFHCDLIADNQTLLAFAFTSLWTIVGLRIFLSA